MDREGSDVHQFSGGNIFADAEIADFAADSFVASFGDFRPGPVAVGQNRGEGDRILLDNHLVLGHPRDGPGCHHCPWCGNRPRSPDAGAQIQECHYRRHLARSCKVCIQHASYQKENHQCKTDEHFPTSSKIRSENV